MQVVDGIDLPVVIVALHLNLKLLITVHKIEQQFLLLLAHCIEFQVGDVAHHRGALVIEGGCIEITQDAVQPVVAPLRELLDLLQLLINSEIEGLESLLTKAAADLPVYPDIVLLPAVVCNNDREFGIFSIGAPAIVKQLTESQQAMQAAIEMLRPVSNRNNNDKAVPPVTPLPCDHSLHLSKKLLIELNQRVIETCRPDLFDDQRCRLPADLNFLMR